MNTRTERLLLGLIAIAYLVLATIYNVTIPLWESPDETGHFGYIVHILTERSLPRVTTGHLGESHQPPLYYAMAALWVLPVDLDNPIGRPNYNPRFVHAGQGGRDHNVSIHTPQEKVWPYQGWSLGVHLIRMMSTFLGLGTVIFTFLSAREVFPDRVDVRALAAALVAFNPQFLFISASVNNDNLLAFGCAGLVWMTLRSLKHIEMRPLGKKAGLGIGVWVVVVMLSKMLGVAIVGLTLAILTLKSWRRWGFGSLTRWLSVLLIVVAIGTGWMWVRNTVLYGDPLGWQTYSDVFSVNLRSQPMARDEWQSFLRTQFHSFWGVFGWMSIYAPRWFFRALQGTLVLALAGWGAILVQSRQRSAGSRHWLVLPAAALAQQALMVGVIQRADGTMWQGRYLFPVIGAIAILLARGLLWWRERPRVSAAWAGIVGAGLLAAAATMPGAVIAPTYRSPATLDAFDVPTAADATFGGMMHLHGYALEEQALLVNLTLFWEAVQKPDFDYSVFVHLTDASGEIIAQDDQAPGADQNRPPTHWEVGEVVKDIHRMPLTRPNDDTLRIRIGVYNWATGERLTVTTDDGTVDSLEIEEPRHHNPNVLMVMVAVAGALSLAIATVLMPWLRLTLRRTGER